MTPLETATAQLKRALQVAARVERAQWEPVPDEMDGLALDKPRRVRRPQPIHHSEAGEEHSGRLAHCPKCSIGSEELELQLDGFAVLLDADRTPRALEA